MPYEYRDEAYYYKPLPIGEGQVITQPSLLLLQLSQTLKLVKKHKGRLHVEDIELVDFVPLYRNIKRTFTERRMPWNGY